MRTGNDRVRRFGLKDRRNIFRQLVALQDTGLNVTCSYGDVCARHGLTKAELRQIEDEGVDHDWVLPDIPSGDESLRRFRLDRRDFN